jgi:hypothetical protein
MQLGQRINLVRFYLHAFAKWALFIAATDKKELHSFLSEARVEFAGALQLARISFFLFLMRMWSVY